jgi:glycosyltransferase involved in cell wall biosynthesis
MRVIAELKARALQHVATWWFPSCAKAARSAVQSVGIATPSPEPRRSKQLLVDVSIIAVSDAGTGIQRVVRSLLLQLLKSPPPGMEIRPVWGTRTRGYRYANSYLVSSEVTDDGSEVDVREGDIFLGLDLASRIAPRRQADFLKWRSNGVRFVFVVYDLLPMLRPDWFTPRAQRSFRHWVSVLAVNADALFCISSSVAVETHQFLKNRFGFAKEDLPVRWFHLGANLPPEVMESTCEAISNSEPLTITRSPTILMVGTIEPRKGHAQVLDAFEQLWGEGVEPTLIIAGRPGWQVETLIARIEHHPELGGRLIWLPDVNDMQLACLYRQAAGLLMASEAEGFGLPIVEAAQYGTPILARDLPVFREVAAAHATYFTARSGVDLARELAAWLEKIADGTVPASKAMEPLTWADSAEQLKTLIVQLAVSQ